MTSTTPDYQLGRLRAALQGGRPVPEDVAQWVLEGLEAFAQGAATTLDHALGLTTAGRSGRLALRYAIQQRNGWLGGALPPRPPGGSRWGRYVELAQAVQAFERVWPRVRDLPEPPAHFTPQQALLWRAFRAHSDVPRTANGLYAALRPRW